MDALTFLSGRVPLFSGLSEEALTGLAANSTLKQAAPGQIVLRAGMTVDGVHVVATGKLEVRAKLPGKSFAVVAELGSGDVFGETSILDKGLADATIKAGAEGAVLLVIPEEPFQRLIERDPAFAARVRALVQSRRPPAPR